MNSIKSVVPVPIKERLRGAQKRWMLDRALRRFAADPLEAATNDWQLLDRLVWSWANEGWSGSAEFLSASARLAATGRRTILECGTGLSTVLMGLAARDSGAELYSLEHQPAWSERIRQVLARYGVQSVNVIDAPLVRYGDFAWYDINGCGFPDAGFDAVICDGPPSDTMGGRYGLLPVMGSRLRPGCTILLDDAMRADEKEVVKRWRAEFGLTVHRESPPDEGFVVLATDAAGGNANGRSYRDT